MKIGPVTKIAITKERDFPATFLDVMPVYGADAYGIHAYITLQHVGPGFSGSLSFRVHGEGLDQMLEVLQRIKDRRTVTENRVMMAEAPEAERNEGSDVDNWEAEQVFQDREGQDD